MPEHDQTSPGAKDGGKKKVDLKDPNRPKRKKARRACFACQRAHLTCGEWNAPSTLFHLFLPSPVMCLCIRATHDFDRKRLLKTVSGKEFADGAIR